MAAAPATRTTRSPMKTTTSAMTTRTTTGSAATGGDSWSENLY
jgi:hypothetical protein